MILQSLLKRPVSSLLIFLLLYVANPLAAQINRDPRVETRFLNPPSAPVTIEHSKVRCTNLIQHVLPSPDQQSAGSCLYMALTCIGEMALSMKNTDGPTDLSERYAMNLGQKLLPQIKNWRTDMIDIFNINGGSCKNENYRYTKGWYYPDQSDGTGPNGSPEMALANAPGARKGTYYNWTMEDSFESVPRISLPSFKRTILYEPSDNSPFATGLHKRIMVEKVKNWLYEKSRPVLVIYNHFGYWHAVVIVGFDDERPGSGWFADKFISYMKQRAAFFDSYDEPQKAEQYRKWASNVISNRNLEGGNSTGKGVFFVRDSIYPDSSAEKYDYIVNETGDESPLTCTYIEHDYTWLLHLVNHIVAIDF